MHDKFHSQVLANDKNHSAQGIYKISQTILPPILSETNLIYEVDEMQTYIGRRHRSCYVYITYAINRITKMITGFVIGSRNKETIGRLIEKLLVLKLRKIYTDGLNIYPSLIPLEIHRCFRYKTNIICSWGSRIINYNC